MADSISFTVLMAERIAEFPAPFKLWSRTSCKGGAILFFGQTFDATTRDILDATNAFEHCFAERFRRDDALDEATSEFKALVGRQFQNSFGEVG